MRSPEQTHLSPEQRESVYKLFHLALEQEPSRRPEFIEQVCVNNDPVRSEVARLLKYGDQEDDLFLEPAILQAAKLLDGEPPETEFPDKDGGPLLVGQQIGRYRILELLGKGGMGWVYKARDDIGKEVAIKVAMAGDEEWRSRFEREARTQAQLNHPNIAAIYGREECDGLRFLVLEFVPGETLAERFAGQGGVASEEAARIFSQIAEALSFLHESGRVHRDLKPSNVMITPGGQVKLLDFGIAKRLVQRPTDVSKFSVEQTTTKSEWTTRHGEIPGTLLYMSPEQLRGEGADERADWWAFGLMLYEALAGRHAFERNSREDVRAAILASEPDWGAMPRSAPKAARELLHRCLEKDPRLRLRGAGEAKRLLGKASPDPLWLLIRKRLERPSYRLGLAAALILIVVLASLMRHTLPGAADLAGSAAKRVRVTVIHDEGATASNICDGNRKSAVIAGALNNRLKNNPGLVVRSAERTLDNLVASINVSLTELALAMDVDWTIRVTTRCDGGDFAIGYEVADKYGRGIARGDQKDINGLYAAVLGAIGVKLGEETISDAERKYRDAMDKLTQYGNSRAIGDAIAALEELRKDNPSLRINSALAKAHYLAYNLATSDGQITEPLGVMRKKVREYCELGSQSGDSAEAVEARINCGYIFAMLGEDETVIAGLEPLRARAGDDPEFHLTLANAYEGLAETRLAEENTAGAEVEFNKAEKSYHDALALRQDWGTLIEVGNFYFVRTNYEKAAEYFEKATALLPSDPHGAAVLGNVYLYLERFDEALSRYHKALAEDDVESHQNYGTALFLMGRCNEAVEQFKKGKEIAAQSAALAPELLGGYADACRCAPAAGCNPGEDYDRAVALIRRQYFETATVYIWADKVSLAAEWLAKRGRGKEALQELGRISNQSACLADCIVSQIKVYYLTANRAEVLNLVRKSIKHAERRKIFFNLKYDPELEGLREDPRYQSVIATLPPSSR